MNDWFRILQDLDNAGICNAEVAKRLQLPRSTVARWKGRDGKPTDMLSANATRLIELHTRYCAEVASSVPLEVEKAL